MNRYQEGYCMSRAAELLFQIEGRDTPNVEESIKELIETKFSESKESRGRASQLLRGLFFSEDEKAKKFIEKLDKALEGTEGFE